jgi:hypothetical protein
MNIEERHNGDCGGDLELNVVSEADQHFLEPLLCALRGWVCVSSGIARRGDTMIISLIGMQ